MEEGCDSAQGMVEPKMLSNRPERMRPRVTSERRRHLYTLALKLAEEVERLSELHERCLLGAMVENLLED